MDDNKLLDGIIEQAQIDAAAIIEKAEHSVLEKSKTSDSSLSRIRQETDKKIAEKIEEIENQMESAINSEKRRQRLKEREILNTDVKALFMDKIKKMIGSAEYEEFLAKAIAEGAIAVNDDEAIVSCSFKEELNESILDRASEIITQHTGKKIKLTLSEKPPHTHQGIIVESVNGRIAYNNQIVSRLRRFDEDIKGVISKWMR